MEEGMLPECHFLGDKGGNLFHHAHQSTDPLVGQDRGLTPFCIELRGVLETLSWCLLSPRKFTTGQASLVPSPVLP